MNEYGITQNSIARLSNSAKIAAREGESSLLSDGDNGELSRVSLVEISEIFVMYDDFFNRAPSFDGV